MVPVATTAAPIDRGGAYSQNVNPPRQYLIHDDLGQGLGLERPLLRTTGVSNWAMVPHTLSRPPPPALQRDRTRATVRRFTCSTLAISVLSMPSASSFRISASRSWRLFFLSGSSAPVHRAFRSPHPVGGLLDVDALVSEVPGLRVSLGGLEALPLRLAPAGCRAAWGTGRSGLSHVGLS